MKVSTLCSGSSLFALEKNLKGFLQIREATGRITLMKLRFSKISQRERQTRSIESVGLQ